MRVSRSRDSEAQDQQPETAAAGPAAPKLHLVQDGAYPDWEAVYRDNVSRIYRLMYARVANRPDAEDLTAQVFLTALPSLRTTASGPEVRGYLSATARTVLAAHWRRRYGLEITNVDLSELEASLASPEEPPAPVPSRSRVDSILSRLPDRYRAVLELRFLRACSMRETARELGISVSNAGVIQHRALRLAADLAEQDLAEQHGGG